MHWFSLRRCLAVLLAVLAASPSIVVAAEPASTARVDIAKGLAENPVFAVLEVYYPAQHKAAVDVVEQGMAKGRSIISLQNEIRASYVALLNSQMSKAEGAYILQAARIAQQQAEAVAASPSDCMAVLGFGTFSRLPQTVLPTQQIAAEQQWAADMLRQTATRPVKRTIQPLDEKKIQVLALTSYDALSSDDARQRIGRLAGKFEGVTDPADQKAICEFSIQLTSAILALPTNEGVETYLSLNAPAAP